MSLLADVRGRDGLSLITASQVLRESEQFVASGSVPCPMARPAEIALLLLLPLFLFFKYLSFAQLS